jgi:hypothetical protein
VLQKRAFLTFVYTVSLSFSVFSEETGDGSVFPVVSSTKTWGETGVAFGLDYGVLCKSSFGDADKTETEMSFVAYNVHQYFLLNESKFGFFIHSSLGLSRVDTIDEKPPQYIDYHGWQVGAIVGPLFTGNLAENVIFFCGAGMSFSFTRERYAQCVFLTGKEEDFHRRTLNFGVGVNVAVQHTKGAIITRVGCSFNYNFFSYAALDSSTKVFNTSGKVSNFSMVEARPYFSIGFRFQ